MGCADSAAEGQGERTAGRLDPLYEYGALWPNGKVDVCYSTTDGDWPEYLERARYVLETRGWAAVAKVDFVGWGPCGASPLPGGQIRIHFTSEGKGLSTSYGPEANTFTELTLPVMPDDPYYRVFDFVMLHEFGHAIGIAHEQVRPDNVRADGTLRCDELQAGEAITAAGTYRTSYFDALSIMNYCNAWIPDLSPGDVAGIQAMYGRRSDIWQGQNPSNHAVNLTFRGGFSLAYPARNAFFVHNDRHLHRLSRSNLSMVWDDEEVTTDPTHDAPPGAPVAVVSRTWDTIDAFYVGDDGAVHASSFRLGGEWTTTRLPGTIGLAKPGSQVAAVASTPGAVDVFYAGVDGKLWWSHWSTRLWLGPTWNDPTAIVGDGSVPLGAHVTAVSRSPDRFNVFYVDNAGVVQNAPCYGNSRTGGCFEGFQPKPNWGHHGLGTSGSCGTAVAGAGISAVGRTSGHIDVFHVNDDGAVCVTSWSSSNGWPAGGGITISASNAMPVRGRLTAVATSRQNLDVFFVGNNRRFRRAYWRGASANATTTSGWVLVDVSDDEYSYPGSSLGVIGRSGTSFDVFGNARPGSALAIVNYSHQWWGTVTGTDSWSWTEIN